MSRQKRVVVKSTRKIEEVFEQFGLLSESTFFGLLNRTLSRSFLLSPIYSAFSLSFLPPPLLSLLFPIPFFLFLDSISFHLSSLLKVLLFIRLIMLFNSVILFCSTSLPLTRTRWVRSTIKRCTVHSLSRALSRNRRESNPRRREKK